HSNTHDRGDRVLHGDNRMSLFVIRKSTSLDQVLIDTHETTGVTTWNIRDLLNVTTHHNDSTLHLLDVKINFLAWNKVRAENANSGTSSNAAREHTTEGEETALIGSGNHLGDVHHEGT